MEFASDDLCTVRRRGAERMVLFSHHPFMSADDWMTVLRGDRLDLLLEMLTDYGAQWCS